MALRNWETGDPSRLRTLAVRTTRFRTARSTTTEYAVGPGSLKAIDSALETKSFILVADVGAASLHPDKMDFIANRHNHLGTLSLPGGEPMKVVTWLERIIHFSKKHGLSKSGAVIALGGGATCDVVAVGAMLVRRGVELILVPTTLLAQIDAAIGGKNGINLGKSKNFLGGFHQPSLVFCDQSFLLTLSSNQFVCGIAEAIKVMAVSDASVFWRYFSSSANLPEAPSSQVWSDLVWDAIQCKLTLLSEDVYEQSPARLLNYGHLFGHLIEEFSEYNLAHGEAVLLGMIIENELSRELRIGSALSIDQLNSIIKRYLTFGCLKYFPAFSDIIVSLKELHEQRNGIINCVCVSSPGQARVVAEVNLQKIQAAWQRTELQIGH